MKKRHSSAVSLFQSIEKRVQQGLKSVEEAANEAANDLHKESMKLMSGKVKTKTLRAMGHPYARNVALNLTGPRRGLQRGKLPVLPINVQSGKLRRNTVLRINKEGSSRTFTVSVKNVGYAKHILSEGGTSKMIARPLKGTIRSRKAMWTKAIRDRWGRGIRRAV